MWPLNLEINYMSTPSKDTMEFSWDIIEDMKNEVIASNSEAECESKWRAFIQSLYDIFGLQEVIDEVNEGAAKLGLR
jgi:hypothetical protein